VKDVEERNVILVAFFVGRGFNRDIWGRQHAGFSPWRVCLAIGNWASQRL